MNPMNQMKINPEALISVDFKNQDLPTSVQHFKPTVFKDGDAFCVILGPDPQEGIFGCGNTLEEALRDWDHHLSDEIDDPTENNETTRYVLDNLNTF
jgi:hypothetical protein